MQIKKLPDTISD